MIALVETKTDIEPPKNCWRKAGFDCCHFSPAIGKAGGICLLWKSYQMIDDMCEICFTSERFIAVKYKIFSRKIAMMIIFAYAPPQEKDKNLFWTQITKFILECQIPCIIIGDLNEILVPEDKLGGAFAPSTRFARLQNFINTCELHSTVTTGNSFTWRRNSTEINNTYEKLDRTLVHSTILQWFPDITTHNFSFSSSDHCIITTNLSSNAEIGRAHV